MKTYLFLFSLLLLIGINVNSQTIMVSDPVTLKSDQEYAIIGQLKDHILLYQDKANEIKVQAYNEKMGLSWEKELELDKKRPTPLEVIGVQNHFFLIYRFKDKGQHFIKVHKYNAAANLVDSMIVVNYGKRFATPKPEVIVSEDKQHILLFHTEFYAKFEVTSFSLKEMKVLWEDSFSPKDLKYGGDFQQMLVDNNGAMHLVLIRENDRVKKDKPHHFEIWSRYSDQEKPIKTTLGLEEKLTYDVLFRADNLNNSLLAGGMYSEKNKARTQGYYFLNIPNQQPQKFQLNFHEFEESFKEELVENKGNISKGLYDVEIQSLAIRRDGGALIICEQRKELERKNPAYTPPTYGSDRITYAADYFYEDLFIMACNQDGSKHWEKILHKKQYSQGDDAAFSSFFMAKTPQHLRLIYNDEIRNEGIVSEYLVNGSGSSDRNSVLNTEDQDLRLRLRESLQTAANEIVVPSETKSKLKLVKLVY